MDAYEARRTSLDKDLNPRGLPRPHDSRGRGVGVRGGRRGGRNRNACETGGPGYGLGQGRNRGKNQ